MNYDEAREIRGSDGKPTGRWHYTSANRRAGTRPIGYCLEHEGHPSREEAERCYWQWEIDQAQQREGARTVDGVADGRMTCKLCAAPSVGRYVLPGAWLELDLCAQHFNRDGLRVAWPFVPGQSRMHS